MTALSREEILGRDDLATAEVDVPEWSGTVRIRALSAASMADWMDKRPTDDTPGSGHRTAALLCALSLVDGEGALMFGASGVDALAQKNTAALQRIAAAILKLNAATPDEAEAVAKN